MIEVPVWAAVATATGAVLLLSVAWPIMMTFSAEVSSQSRATGVGLLGASNQSGGVGGAAIGGVLLATSGFPGRVPMSGRNGVLSVGHRAIHAPAQALNEAIWLEPQIAIVYGK